MRAWSPAGVDSVDGVVAVYDKLPPESDDPREWLRRTMESFGRLGKPILFVPARTDDVGTHTLPGLGALTVRLEDPDGRCPYSGHAFWRHAGRPHGGSATGMKNGGILQFVLRQLLKA